MSTFKTLALAATAALGLAAAAHAQERLVVGATAIPHAEILEFVKPILAADGLDLEIKVFTDYIQPNAQLVSGELDANYYQYRPFLYEWNRQSGTDLTAIVPVHIEPFVAYSTKHTSVDQIPDGGKVAIPNDPVNGGRGLLLLQQLGLIKVAGKAVLTEPDDALPTLKDVTENPKNLEIVELESALLPRALAEVDLGALNGNYVFEAGLDINKALFLDRGQDGYNIWSEWLVTRPELKDDPRIAKLGKALNSEETRKFIADKYKGAIVAAF